MKYVAEVITGVIAGSLLTLAIQKAYEKYRNRHEHDEEFRQLKEVLTIVEVSDPTGTYLYNASNFKVEQDFNSVYYISETREDGSVNKYSSDKLDQHISKMPSGENSCFIIDDKYLVRFNDCDEVYKHLIVYSHMNAG